MKNRRITDDTVSLLCSPVNCGCGEFLRFPKLLCAYLNSGLIALGRGLAHGERRRRGGGGGGPTAPLRAPASPVGQAAPVAASAAARPQSIPAGEGGMNASLKSTYKMVEPREFCTLSLQGSVK